jgi:hypothetical protein
MAEETHRTLEEQLTQHKPFTKHEMFQTEKKNTLVTLELEGRRFV